MESRYKGAKLTKKLTLNRETLRELTDREAGQVVGAGGSCIFSWSCGGSCNLPTCGGSCNLPTCGGSCIVACRPPLTA